MLSYLYTILSQKSLSKSQPWRCLWCKFVIVCQLIRVIFSIRVQWIYNFHFPFQRKTCFVYTMRDLLWLVPSDACGTNQIEAQLLVATFSIDSVERYHYTMKWRCLKLINQTVLLQEHKFTIFCYGFTGWLYVTASKRNKSCSTEWCDIYTTCGFCYCYYHNPVFYIWCMYDVLFYY